MLDQIPWRGRKGKGVEVRVSHFEREVRPMPMRAVCYLTYDERGQQQTVSGQLVTSDSLLLSSNIKLEVCQYDCATSLCEFSCAFPRDNVFIITRHRRRMCVLLSCKQLEASRAPARSSRGPGHSSPDQ